MKKAKTLGKILTKEELKKVVGGTGHCIDCNMCIAKGGTCVYGGQCTTSPYASSCTA